MMPRKPPSSPKAGPPAPLDQLAGRALVPEVVGPAAGAVPAVRPMGLPPDRVWEAFFLDRHPPTARAYRLAFRDFAGVAFDLPRTESGAREAMLRLLLGGPGLAFAHGTAYRATLERLGRQSATVASRLAALRAYTQFAQRCTAIDWALSVESPKVQAYRDTRGPGRDGWQRVIALVRRRARAAPARPKAIRDLALLLLLHDRGLREAEAIALDWPVDVDLDSDPPAVAVIGKGQKSDKEWLTINRHARAALEAWVAARGDDPGPLFVGLDNRSEARGARNRLDLRSVRKVCRAWGVAAGLPRPLRPHGLRHQGITRALDMGVEIRTVQRFSRHKKIETLLVYDDNRQDLGGKVTDLLGEDSS